MGQAVRLFWVLFPESNRSCRWIVIAHPSVASWFLPSREREREKKTRRNLINVAFFLFIFGGEKRGGGKPPREPTLREGLCPLLLFLFFFCSLSFSLVMMIFTFFYLIFFRKFWIFNQGPHPVTWFWRLYMSSVYLVEREWVHERKKGIVLFFYANFYLEY